MKPAGTVGAYCLYAWNAGAAAATSATTQYVYFSQSGGLNATAQTVAAPPICA